MIVNINHSKCTFNTNTISFELYERYDFNTCTLKSIVINGLSLVSGTNSIYLSIDQFSKDNEGSTFPFSYVVPISDYTAVINWNENSSFKQYDKIDFLRGVLTFKVFDENNTFYNLSTAKFNIVLEFN